jgi:hypothetical protein
MHGNGVGTALDDVAAVQDPSSMSAYRLASANASSQSAGQRRPTAFLHVQSPACRQPSAFSPPTSHLNSSNVTQAIQAPLDEEAFKHDNFKQQGDNFKQESFQQQGFQQQGFQQHLHGLRNVDHGLDGHEDARQSTKGSAHEQRGSPDSDVYAP